MPARPCCLFSAQCNMPRTHWKTAKPARLSLTAGKKLMKRVRLAMAPIRWPDAQCLACLQCLPVMPATKVGGC